MSKIKLLIIICTILLLSNVLLMWQLWERNKPRERGEGPRLEIISRLKLDEKQVKQYDVLVQEHRSQMRQKEEEIRELKKSLYQTLLGDTTSRYSLIQQIAEQQKEVENINLRHFADIGKVCRLEQQVSYKKLVSDLSELFMHRKPPPPRH
ncbi:MAG: hypothetical protein V4561_12215 [Bacteroidota bacterium]